MKHFEKLKHLPDERKQVEKRSAPRPILTSTEAQLFVVDIKASCDFYTAKLGFAVAFSYGDPPYYARSPATRRGLV